MMALNNPKNKVGRVVVGGGLFGCYAALVLAEKGHTVRIVEQGSQLLGRASFVNQARLHTGLHYPRSFLTASDSLRMYQAFRDRFAPAIHDFTQIYAVASRNSQTSGNDFEAFIKRIEIQAQELNPDRWFHRGTVSRAFAVEEPSFDAAILRQLMLVELAQCPKITVEYDVAVVAGEVSEGEMQVALSDGTLLNTEGIVIAAYAGTNAIRKAFGLEPLPIVFELAEILLGRTDQDLLDIGFTVMDGPFWSLMPFGKTGQVSLSSVGFTPLRRSPDQPVFSCQADRPDCRPLHLQECTSCPVRPKSASDHQFQQMSQFLKLADSFEVSSSMLTVKAILKSTEVDDARPTLIQREKGINITTILSGKVSTLFDLETGLK